MSLIVSLLGLVAWAIWGVTVATIDPSTPFAPLAFYGSLFVALTCTLGRLRERPAYDVAGEVRVSARPALGHAASIAILLLFALWLQSLRMLTSINAVLMVTSLAFVELGFWLTRERRPKPRRRPRRPRPVDAVPAAEG